MNSANVSTCEVKPLDCDTPRAATSAPDNSASNTENQSSIVANIRNIDTLDQLRFINLLNMSKSPIVIKDGEMMFYSCLDLQSGLKDYIYAPYIRSEYIKIRTCYVNGLLIKDFKLGIDNTAATFISSQVNRYPEANKYYKICILEDNEYNEFIKLFELKTISDIYSVIKIADYMLLDYRSITKSIYELLESLEKYAIGKYWNRLCTKPAYNEYLKYRMFKTEAVEMADYNTFEIFKEGKDIINRKRDFYDTINDTQHHRNEINNVFCDEIPTLAENESNWDNKFDAFRDKYYSPPSADSLINRSTTVQLFEKANEFCQKFNDYKLVFRLYRTFALVPEFAHTIFAKEIQIIYRDAIIKSYTDGDGVFNPNTGLYKQWNRFTGYAFYLMYLEECYNSSTTIKESRYVFTSDDVEYWIHSKRSAYTMAIQYKVYYDYSRFGYKFVHYGYNSYADTNILPAYEPFTVGNLASICYTGYSRPIDGSYGYKGATNGIHNMNAIRHRLMLASNGLFNDSFPWQECSLNLTGSLLVACTAVSIHDASNDVIDDKFYNNNASKPFIGEFIKSADYRFMQYFNTLYADADIDLYIDDNNVESYLEKARTFISYIKNRYHYIHIEEITNDYGFTRFKVRQLPLKAVHLQRNQILKNIDIYMNHYGNLYRYHLPVVRMSYNGERIYFYPSCLSALFTGVNGNYKWFKSQVSALDIIIKYMRRGFSIILNTEERRILEARLEYLKSVENENTNFINSIKKLKDYIKNKLSIPVSDINVFHSINNISISFTSTIEKRLKCKIKPHHCNVDGNWKVSNGQIINPSIVFAANYKAD